MSVIIFYYHQQAKLRGSNVLHLSDILFTGEREVYTSPPTTVNQWAVSILLECFLVIANNIIDMGKQNPKSPPKFNCTQMLHLVNSSKAVKPNPV